MPQNRERPTLLACAECRQKHLKCDGKVPRCTRCLAHRLSCLYTPSRRGLNSRSRGKRLASTAPPSPESMISIAVDSLNGSASSTTHLNYNSLPDVRQILRRNSQSRTSYYTHFHRAHPILLAEKLYPADYPDYLNLLVCYIGQRCDSIVNPEPIRSDLVGLLMSSDHDEQSVSRVQALTLYAIILHSDRSTEDALDCIARATRISNALGLERLERDDSRLTIEPLRLESFRRTFWELHILATYFAALHQRADLVPIITSDSPFLPCEETAYTAGDVLSAGPDLASFERRFFDTFSPPIRPSAYSYRLEAARLVDRVIKLPVNADASSVRSVDNALAGWSYYFPTESSSEFDGDGLVDPLLFQAQTLAHCASIVLHFPRSGLPMTVPTTREIRCTDSCANPSSPASSHHAAKALAAAQEIANLASLPWQNFADIPLFVCTLVLGAIVHLATASTHRGHQDSVFRQQCQDGVLLILGVLGRYGKRWPVAAHAHKHLKEAAGLVFAPRSNTAETLISITASSYDGVVNETDAALSLTWFDLFSSDALPSHLLSLDSNTATR